LPRLLLLLLLPNNASLRALLSTGNHGADAGCLAFPDSSLLLLLLLLPLLLLLTRKLRNVVITSLNQVAIRAPRKFQTFFRARTFLINNFRCLLNYYVAILWVNSFVYPFA
jgi:hypothetical protein